jgi:hypothetical protein
MRRASALVVPALRHPSAATGAAWNCFRACSTTANEDEISWDIDEGPPAAPAVASATAAGAPTATTTAAAAETAGKVLGSSVRRRLLDTEAGGGAPAASAFDEDPEYQRMPADELVSRALGYLSTGRAPSLLVPALEASIFPVLTRRVHELSITQILDVIETRWPAETIERHYEPFMEAAKARILREVKEYEDVKTAQALANRGWESVPDEIQAVAAATTLTALQVARCIVVLGLRGRRRRDLELFKPLGNALALGVNDIRDPHTLCYVLIAFQASRIRPPDSFLALVGRRLPVLNKKYPMSPLPAYRALMVYDRHGYELMNPYRFLADRVMDHIKSELQREGGGGAFVEPRIVTPVGGSPRPSRSGDDDDDLDEADFAILRSLRHGGEVEAAPARGTTQQAASREGMSDQVPQGSALAAAVPHASAAERLVGGLEAERHPVAAPQNAEEDSATIGEREAEELILDRAMPNYAVRPELATKPRDASDPSTPDPLGIGKTTAAMMAERRDVRQRFYKLTQLKPPQLTKMLSVLGRKAAPRQQYLRPLVGDVLVPSLAHFNPPSFSRLVGAMRAFQSEEGPLIDKVIETMCERGPEHVVLGDILDMLFLLSRPTVPLTPKAADFFDLCRRAFEDGSRLRPKDMRCITADLKLIWKLKLTEDEHADSPAFRSLLAVVDGFARRMASFLELGLVEPLSADGFLEMCQELKPGAEPSDSVARLIDARRVALADGEEAYNDLVQVNVRDIFLRLQTVNSIVTHRGFRPVNAITMQQFKAMLDFMRADDILEAVHLYQQAYPGALSLPVRRVVGAFVVDKLALEVQVLTGQRPAPPPPPAPEMVPLSSLDDANSSVDGHRRIYQPYDVTSPKYSPLLFTPASLAKFANLVLALATWSFLGLKAKQFSSPELTAVVQERLSTLDKAREALALDEMRTGLEQAPPVPTQRAPGIIGLRPVATFAASVEV